MTAATFDVVLRGCRPEPLASYLKALGVLRLVAEQRDHDARGFWKGEHFVLRSSLDEGALLDFFLNEWRPTPVIAPWNGGSGFYPKDNRAAAEAILSSKDARLASTRSSIGIARQLIEAKGWTERPADADKVWTLAALRAKLPDEALAWLDAAVVLGDDRLLFPPLLGTGGNDGRLDFSNNFQQRVVEVLREPNRDSLASALLGTLSTSSFKGTMGQYLPSANDRTNPWDFVLLIEGAMVFAAAATRRLESASPTVMVFPFHARAASGLATLVDSDAGESRDELWLPLWNQPSTFRAVRHLFAEGRATVGTGTADGIRAAATGLDFARSVSALGVDRGIEAFSRIGFHVRNGLAYFATPLGRFATGEVSKARLLDDIDSWFEVFRQRTTGTGVPARLAVVRRRLEQAMFEAAASGATGPMLLELGAAEKALGASLAFTKKAFLRPVPALSTAWSESSSGDSVEYRLAAALASRRKMRPRVLPLDGLGRFGRSDDVMCVFQERPLIENLHELLRREDFEDPEAANKLADKAHCSLSDIASFISGETDDAAIERWLRGLLLIRELQPTALPRDERAPPVCFALLTLVQPRTIALRDGRKIVIPRTTGVLARACGGDAREATAAAIRRLNASHRSFPTRALTEPSARMRRIAAALAFPLTISQYQALERMILSADSTSSSSQPEPS